jgi:hypothetical protein
MAAEEREVLNAEQLARDHPEDQNAHENAVLLRNALDKTLFYLKPRVAVPGQSRISSKVWTTGYMQRIFLSDRGTEKVKNRMGKLLSCYNSRFSLLFHAFLPY